MAVSSLATIANQTSQSQKLNVAQQNFIASAKLNADNEEVFATFNMMKT